MRISNRAKALGTMSLAVTALLGATAGTVASASPLHKQMATVSYKTFNRNFTTMSLLKPIAAKGSGGITAILPDTVSSTRYVDFDAPFLTKALQKAGIPKMDITVQNAHGSDATELADAQAAITKGDKVLIMDPYDPGVGIQIEKLAAKAGVKVIDYDRLDVGGSRQYYVSFNNVQVGTLIGQGFVSCVASWHVASPQVLVMHGDDTDNNAKLFAQGYDKVLQPYFSSGKYTLVGKLQPNEVPAGTWTPDTALSEFQQEYTAHPGINAVVSPNDENAAPIITYLQSKGIKADTFPITGQDATPTGLGNILTGYQCGTVYKPIDLEAQAAVALAVYLRAGEKPPKALVNGTTTDTKEMKQVPSVLEVPEWVTAKNMKSTVIADNFVSAKTLCAPPNATAAACKAAGINP